METTKSTQEQINEINLKLDTLLDYVNEQRLRTNSIDDLVSDVAIIGKDVYDSTVEELSNHSIEFDMDEVKQLLIRVIKNIGVFNNMMGMLESGNDLVQDMLPIANEVIVDFTHKMGEFEKKGYFEFFGETMKIMDNIVTHFSKEDVKLLADNIVGILETVKTVTQPEMLGAMDNAIKVFASIETENVPEYSLMKLMRELRTHEMKKALGFMVTLMKNLSNINSNNQ